MRLLLLAMLASAGCEEPAPPPERARLPYIFAFEQPSKGGKPSKDLETLACEELDLEDFVRRRARVRFTHIDGNGQEPRCSRAGFPDGVTDAFSWLVQKLLVRVSGCAAMDVDWVRSVYARDVILDVRVSLPRDEAPRPTLSLSLYLAARRPLVNPDDVVLEWVTFYYREAGTEERQEGTLVFRCEETGTVSRECGRFVAGQHYPAQGPEGRALEWPPTP